MKLSKNKFGKVFFGRVARNIYFWLIYILFPVINLNNNENQDISIVLNIFLNLLTTMIFAVVVYVNNLWLLPKFFSQRKIIVYFLLLGAWILVCSFGIKEYYNFLFDRFPDMFSNSEERMRDFPISIAVFLVLLHISGFTMAKFANDYFVREKWTKELEKKQVESELTILKSQINPHFLFNTLNSIYSLALKKSEDTPDVVLKLSDLLRYMLYECNSDRVSLEKEIQMLQNYVELEQIRTRRADKISFTVIGNPQGLLVPPLIWIHFAENAFKHGMGSRLNDGFVNIVMHIAENSVELVCENNFKDKESDAHKAGGIGLENVKKRLRLIYENNYHLKIEKNSEVYSVILRIPAENPTQIKLGKLTQKISAS
jgi:hypothetical protein